MRVWALDVWGELVPSKIFNPLFPVLKAGHSVSYSCVWDVCREWVIGVNFPVWLVCYAHVFHVQLSNSPNDGNTKQHQCQVIIKDPENNSGSSWDLNPGPF